MAWQWNHTYAWRQEVARLIQAEPKQKLCEAWAEIQAASVVYEVIVSEVVEKSYRVGISGTQTEHDAKRMALEGKAGEPVSTYKPGEVEYVDREIIRGSDSPYEDGTYEDLIAEAQAMDDAILAQSVEDFAFRQRQCDNGGYNAWYCPEGCHTVNPPEPKET